MGAVLFSQCLALIQHRLFYNTFIVYTSLVDYHAREYTFLSQTGLYSYTIGTIRVYKLHWFLPHGNSYTYISFRPKFHPTTAWREISSASLRIRISFTILWKSLNVLSASPRGIALSSWFAGRSSNNGPYRMSPTQIFAEFSSKVWAAKMVCSTESHLQGQCMQRGIGALPIRYMNCFKPTMSG